MQDVYYMHHWILWIKDAVFAQFFLNHTPAPMLFDITWEEYLHFGFIKVLGVFHYLYVLCLRTRWLKQWAKAFFSEGLFWFLHIP